MAQQVAEAIARSLRERIERGDWGDGARLPPERDLAATYGVARNTIRRALGILGESMQLSRTVGRGTFIDAAPPAPLPDVLARIAGTSPADMMAIRQMLEPGAAALAATSASAAELARIAEAHRQAERAPDLGQFEHWDAEFHHRIFAASRNELLRELHDILRHVRNQAPWLEMKRRAFSEDRRRLYCAEHEALVDALMRRDPEGARGAMLAHLRSVEDNLFDRGARA